MRASGVSTVTATLVLAAVALAGCRPDERQIPRNLLLITLDTLRADHLGAYGYDRPTSPAIDRFAVGATVFEDVTCSVPTTLPSHASIFTGLRPAQHGLRRNGDVPTGDLLSIFDLLKANGSATAGIIAAQVLGPESLAGMGLDEIIFAGPKSRYQTRGERVNNHALAWIEGHKDEPFALWVHYYDTHEPYSPPEALARTFDRGYRGALPDRLSVETLVGFNRPAARAELSPEDLAHVNDLYDAEIAYLDAQVGQLLERLEELGALHSTLVVIVGDHGQALGDSDFFGHGLRLLEPVIKIPLIIRLPDQVTGRRVSQPVESIDLVPTLTELFELEAPPDLAGISLVPAFEGRQLTLPQFRFVERRAYPEQPEVVGVALHGGDWKAVYYRDEDGSELRHLGRRAGGLDGQNLYQPDGDEARWLESAWQGLAAAGNETATELDDETLRMLRALGYID